VGWGGANQAGDESALGNQQARDPRGAGMMDRRGSPSSGDSPRRPCRGGRVALEPWQAARAAWTHGRGRARCGGGGGGGRDREEGARVRLLTLPRRWVAGPGCSRPFFSLLLLGLVRPGLFSFQTDTS
jgi:hypothetical protein